MSVKKVYVSVIYAVLLFLVASNGALLSQQNEKFSMNLLKALKPQLKQQNVIYSPISIQACLVLALLGSGTETANELSTGLNLPMEDVEKMAVHYGNFLTKSFSNAKKNGPVLKLANRMYVNEGLQLKPVVSNLAEKYLNSRIEVLPFANSELATKSINSWVETATNGQIHNLMSPDSVNSDTSVLLVNAISFKGKWAKPFSKHSTHKQEFTKTTQEKTQVDMMNAEEEFRYAELPELKATAIELPYENSDISMLIILPNEVDGLQEMEDKLQNMDLNVLLEKLAPIDVDLYLPKFKIETELDLKNTLLKMGISKIFSDNGGLSQLFDNAPPQKVSDIKHKGYLDVNEAGTEAAAATFIKVVPMMLNLSSKTLRVDHPFFFAIRNQNTIYYAGHVVNI